MAHHTFRAYKFLKISNMDNPVNKELLQKYFAGGATIFEKKLIDEWAKEPQNQETFYRMLSQKEIHNPQFIPDVEGAVKRHFNRFQAKNEKDLVEKVSIFQEPLFINSVSWKKWSIAASIALIIGISVWINWSNILFENYHSEYGEVRVLSLEDGSEVILNANSTLKVPRFGFGNKVREVFLEGEGQFSVKHTLDNLPFIVKTSRGLDVVVVGTEFTVFSRNRGAKVVLNKGKVRLHYTEGNKNKQILMMPGELVTFDTAHKLKEISKTIPANHAAWTEHRFVFKETTLHEISTIFLENFGVQVKIEDEELADWTVSGSFTANNADELLEILADASNLNFRHEQDFIIISNP